MNQGFIKVAAGTPGVTVADCRANTKAILEMIKEMEAQHAKIMVFPELCITGYTCQDLFSAEKASGQCVGEPAYSGRRDQGCGCADFCRSSCEE